MLFPGYALNQQHAHPPPPPPPPSSSFIFFRDGTLRLQFAMENSGGNKIIYSFVARGTTVLAEYTSYSGNFSQLAVEALEKSNTQQERFTYTCDGYTFNFLKRKIFSTLACSQSGLPLPPSNPLPCIAAFLAVADDEVGREVAFGFLEKVAEDFEQRIGQKASDAIAHSLDREYG